MHPFSPKSNARLQPGDFWAIPLHDGSFACGRVIELPPKGMPGSKVSFLGALLDWHSTQEPSAEGIAGRPTLEQAQMHVLAIQRSGGYVLGNRPLAEDGIEPLEFNHGGVIQRGYTPVNSLRGQNASQLPAFSTWGYNVIVLRAHKHFLGYIPSDA